MVTMKRQLVSPIKNAYSGTNGRKYITIHETANTSRGANAQAHANLQSKGFSASWHWQVDDKQAIQSFPHTARLWHAGDGRGNGNLNSIGIEICVNSDGDFKKAVENAASLVRKIMKDEGIPKKNVVQHNHWSGKNCPTYLRNGSKGIKWNDFLKMLDKKDGDLTVSQYNQLKKLIDAQDKKINSLEKQLAKKQNAPSNNHKPNPSHAKAWKWAEEQGLLNGQFPMHPMTREQYATTEYRKVNDNK